MVYRYGVPALWKPPEELVEQIRLAHDLQNMLVEIERGYEQAKIGVWASAPLVAKADEAVAAAEAQVLEAGSAVKDARKNEALKATVKELTDVSKAARAGLKEARAQRKTVREACYGQVRAGMREASEARQKLIKATYADFAQDRGLYWATWNDVVAHHETACKTVARFRAAGKPAEHRFRTWDGTGTISVQLQRAAGDPQRSPELMASGNGKWRNVLRVNPWYDPKDDYQPTRVEKHGMLGFSIGGSRMAQVPVQVHRMMPAEADVTMARLSRFLIGGEFRWKVTITVLLPDIELATEGPALAVHMGWRRMEDGSVRVATINSDHPLPPATNKVLANVVRRIDERNFEVRAPAQWGSEMADLAKLSGVRDTAHEAAKDVVRAWLRDHPLPTPEGEDEAKPALTAAEVARWRSPRRLARLTRQWRANPPEGAEDIVDMLVGWEKQDVHLWRWHGHQTAQLAARRLDTWRVAAAYFSDNAGSMVIDGADIAALTERQDPDAPAGEGLPGRRSHTAAAPGELRTSLLAAAARRGVPAELAKADWLTHEHLVCGTRITQTDDPAPVRWCPTCGTHFDVEMNAVAALQQRFESSGGAVALRERTMQAALTRAETVPSRRRKKLKEVEVESSAAE